MSLKFLRMVNSPMAARFWESIHEQHLPLLEEFLRRLEYEVKGLSCCNLFDGKYLLSY